MTTDVSVNVRWDPDTQREIDDFEYDYDGGNSSSRLFERSRIRALADERETVQKKTFCKWVNSHLIRANCKISDLYTDLRDGKKLIKLLEILSGERLPKPTKGKMRIHCLENVDKALQFLLREQRVHLENLGSHDIVDGNPRLTLGLIWTIILRFQIQDITIEEIDNQETKSAKDALLLWAQMKTAGYNNVNVRNFTSSWKDGLAFNAIIHKHRPDLIQYEKLNKSEPIKNLNNAFQVAEEKLGLARLLDAEDVWTDNPDEKSIITYVVTYYHYFSKMKAETVQGRRIGGVMGKAMENEKLITDYERLTSDLLHWIETKIIDLSDRTFANSLDGVQQQLAQFNSYRTKEKPPKFSDKGNLEIALFTIQSRLRANNQKPYTPGDGKTLNDINRAWERLERSEHERELALREEMIRQEKLKQLAWRFDKKAGMREQWLSENQRLISKDTFGDDLPAVEAASKKHEAIETDIMAYEDRVQAVVSVANELKAENYHDSERIIARKDNVIKLWNYLLELLANRRMRLEKCMTLQHIFHEMQYLDATMADLRAKLKSDDYGKHLMGVEDLLQKHSLIEADINMLGERIRNVVRASEDFIDDETEAYKPCEPSRIKSRNADLERDYADLVKQAMARRKRLEDSRQFWQFHWDVDQEESWIKEKKRILSSDDIGHDLSTVHMLIGKNKTLEDELGAHEQQTMDVLKSGEDLVKSGHQNSADIQARINQVEAEWDRLKELQAIRTNRLNEAIDFHQFFTDADDVDAWMLDTFRLVTSKDVGVDEVNADSLLRKHDKIHKDLEAYRDVINNLRQQTERLGENDRSSPQVAERLTSIEKRYAELLDLSNQRKQRLIDASALYKLFNEANGVEQWIVEKRKMLNSMQPTQDMEDTEVMRHRFETFEQEMENNKGRVEYVNNLTRNLVEAGHPDSKAIIKRQEQLDRLWNDLKNDTDKKRASIEAAHGVQTFYLDCSETVSWIDEKTKSLKDTEELGNNLSGIMTLQRRLNGMERDLKAIQDKLAELEAEKKRIEKEHPEEAKQINEEVERIRASWVDLNKLKKDRDAKLEEAGDVHRFLRDLDHFQAWLSKTQKDIASEDIPSSLPEAEQLLARHKQIKEEVDNYKDDHRKMMEYGEGLTRDQADPQYLFLRQRLQSLDDDWKALHKMLENRERFLSQQHALQMFLRDAKQAETVLNQQENYLCKDEIPSNLEEAEELIKKHEAFLTSMDANEEKLRSVDSFAQRLELDGHFASDNDRDKVSSKANAIAERRNANLRRAAEMTDRLKDQLQLQQFLSNCDELQEWMQEKSIVAEDETYRSAKTLHSKWTRHRAHELEIAANKDRLNRLRQEGEQLKADQPDLVKVVDARLDDIDNQFANLEHVTKEKGQKLFDANRPLLYEQTCDAIDEWIDELEPILSSEPGQDLTGVNLALAKQQNIESQLEDRARQVNELENQAVHLEKIEPEKGEVIKARKIRVEERFQKLQAPILERKQQLIKKKEALQFRRDVEDERMRIREKLPLAQSEDYGNNLHDVQVLLRKNQSLRNEIDNHEPRIMNICQTGNRLIEEGHENAPEFKKLIELLLSDWDNLKRTVDNRRVKLLENEKVQQYYFDASEAEQWMSEQELYMMSDDRGKDEFTAQNIKRKHEAIAAAIRDYNNTMNQLKDTANSLINEKVSESERIEQRQSEIDKLYTQLNNLASERRSRLNEALELFKLNREIEDLIQWISERDAIANSHELGQDLDHVIMLRERFKQFAKDTEKCGTERVERVNATADQLILSGHADNNMIANWKEMLEEAWTDLLEIIKTRSLELAASHRSHQFFHDCRDLNNRITEKKNSLNDDVGRDAASVAMSQRKHEQFEHDLQPLIDAAELIRKESAELQTSYAGSKSQEIRTKEQEVTTALQQLLSMCEARRKRLDETSDLFKFLNKIRELMSWMEDVVRQMNTSEKPRDVGGVEQLMKNHQDLKAEIESKQALFEECFNLGAELLSRNHYAAPEISEKLDSLKRRRKEMDDRWEERWDHLKIILEVYQFARDAAVAEAWLVAQDPYLLSTELGHTIEEVLELIKKHEDYEKTAAAQHEHFVALQKPTTFEVRELQLIEEERARSRSRDTTATRGQTATSSRLRSPSDGSQTEVSSLTERGEAERTTDRPVEDGGLYRGHIYRKHLVDSSSNPASDRKWVKLFFVVKPGQLVAYKDQKHAKQDKYQDQLDLSGALVEEARDYKKPHCIRLKLVDGNEFMFKAKDDAEMNLWIDQLRVACGEVESSTMSQQSSRAQTLPASISSSAPEKKKGGFFTLKRK
uniref:Spectrin beta chain n=1 Tax=Aceria tosichella TaxID=561515 RepID=A0A6G1SQG5_9ACAR